MSTIRFIPVKKDAQLKRLHRPYIRYRCGFII